MVHVDARAVTAQRSAGQGNGANFFRITGESFESIPFNTTFDVVADVRQVRRGTAPGQTPEPASLALLGLGLLGVGAVRRRPVASA